jgi:hypothetical protein
MGAIERQSDNKAPGMMKGRSAKKPHCLVSLFNSTLRQNFAAVSSRVVAAQPPRE